MRVELKVNQIMCVWETTPSETLADALRAHGYVSVKKGCGRASCGMCTVWLDGKAVLSCTLLLCRLGGREVTTLEGVQEQARVLGSYLVAEGADQCGFCAPGFIMTALAMERELPAPIAPETAERYLAGNLCRCTGYQSKLRAVMAYLRRNDDGVVKS